MLFVAPILLSLAFSSPDTYNIDMRPPWAVHQTTNNETKLKEEFAELLLRRPYEAFNCAKVVSGDDFALCYVRSKSWPSDAYVREHQQKLIAQFGASHFLPTREELVHDLWARTQERTADGNRMMEDRDAITATKLIGEFAGYLKNGSDTGGNGANVTNQTLNITFVQPDGQKQNLVDVPKTIEHQPLPSLDIKFKD